VAIRIPMKSLRVPGSLGSLPLKRGPKPKGKRPTTIADSRAEARKRRKERGGISAIEEIRQSKEARTTLDPRPGAKKKRGTR
jgi:hypothetical protein